MSSILVSGIDDQNNRAVSEGMKFPLAPWPRPIQVQSFFSSLPMDSDSFSSRSDKQLLNADINGNPFGRSARSSNNLTSFVSSQLVDYNNGSLISETKNRKNKRLRNSVNKGVLSENIAGHRGEEDIDSLVQYINSSDKKNKSGIKGNTSNQIISNKNNLLHENERKKSLSKETKNCPKNVINSVKKKLTRSNSLENMTSTPMTTVENVFEFESKVSAIDLVSNDTKSYNCETAIKNLDINSNEENKIELNEKKQDKNIDESSLQSSIGQNFSEVSSFAADFYSTTDVSSQTVEESGFLTVKKKQRKKQSKRSDSHRWRNAQTQRNKGMMLPLAESKCGKQDSRRKSTSSVPHSEHSSADNSDLDSVHSLPVRGSVPHPTQPHPHTTPSSSSSTPQASYADIARMPISKLNSTSPNIVACSSQVSTKPHAGDQEVKRTDGNGVSSVKRKVSDSREPPSVVKSMSRSPVSDKEGDISDVKIRSHAKSTREINTQTEPENLSIPVNSKEMVNNKSKKLDESLRGLCNSCSSRKNNCCCSKSEVCQRQKGKNMDIPPVIMKDLPSSELGLYFGFDMKELLEMDVAKSVSLDPKHKSKEIDSKEVEVSGRNEGIFEISNVNTKNMNVDDSCSKSSPSLDVTPKNVHSQDLKQEQSSHLKVVRLSSGKTICYKETDINVKKFNLSELNTFLANEFQSVTKEIESISKNNSSKVKYYVDNEKA
ncbi:uncharacterized protein CEXT_65191 [Caerostris extrusa]|uniref:Uncharacterized protein n=1 Tax=Caerostris extrusa TaxID=172846 RepID=A0AAV4TYG4_CAEEX|nr:uncharacterized protein CEXT_65191 [Caerostris extrusa]